MHDRYKIIRKGHQENIWLLPEDLMNNFKLKENSKVEGISPVACPAL